MTACPNISVTTVRYACGGALTSVFIHISARLVYADYCTHGESVYHGIAVYMPHLTPLPCLYRRLPSQAV